MNESQVTVIGNVATTPQLRGNGVPLCTFRVAQTARKIVDGEWQDGHTSFFDVACFRSLAENVLASVRKGDPVVVAGRLKVREWSTADKSGTSVDLDATSVGHDLLRGRSSFLRSPRRSQPAPTEAERELAALEGEMQESLPDQVPAAAALA